MFIRHYPTKFQVLLAVSMKRAKHVVERTNGVTVAVKISKDEVLYTFANCSADDQFSRRTGRELVAERASSMQAVPHEIVNRLFSSSAEIDYTMLNPQLILETVARFVINNKL